MKILLSALLSLVSALAFCQDWQWQNQFASQLFRQGKICLDAEGNVYSFVTWNNQMQCKPDPLGVCPNEYFPQYSLLLVKTSPEGVILKAKIMKSPSGFYDYFAQGIEFDAAGNLFLLVEYRNFGNLDLQHEIWRLDSDWNFANGAYISHPNGVYSRFKVDDAGNVYIVYHGDTGLNIRKYDPDLNIVWTTTSTGSGPIPSGIAVTDDGKLYISGTCNSQLVFTNNNFQIPSGTTTGFLAKFDANTGLCSAAGKLKNPVSLNLGPNDQLIVAGNFGDNADVLGTSLTCNSSGCAYVIKVNEDLTLDNLIQLDDGMLVFTAKTGTDGSVYVGGQNQGGLLTQDFGGHIVELPPTPQAIFVAKLTPNLTYLWSNYFGSTGYVNSDNQSYKEGVHDLAPTNDGKLFITGLYKAPSLVVEGDTLIFGAGLFTAKVTDGSFAAGGKAWFDLNGNGNQDPGEQPFRLKGFLDESGRIATFSNRLGRFSLPLETGSHSLAPSQIPAHFTVVPPIWNYNILQTDAPGPDTLNFRLVPDSLVSDLAVDITPSHAPVPDLVFYFQMECQNHGTLHEDATLFLKLNPHFATIQFDPIPNISNDTIFWTFTNLAPGEKGVATVRVYTTTDIMFGDTLASSAWVTTPAGDPTPNDNFETVNQPVMSSFDPNDKQVSPAGPIRLAQQADLLEKPFEYTVRFQNTGNYPATKVVVLDTLSPLLRAATFSLESASHSVKMNIREGHILEFVFNNIFLSDSINDEPNSHGFVKFSILPVSGLQPGDEVPNTAHIYFDFNDPVITNTATVKIIEVLPSGAFVEEVNAICGQPLTLGPLGYPNWNSASIVQAPAHGEAVLFHDLSTADTIIFTPFTGFQGVDTLVVACAQATQISCDTGYFILNISCPSQSDVTENYSLNCDNSLLITGLGYPTWNPPVIVLNPQHGSLVFVDADPSIPDSLHYTPAPDFMGVDSFVVECAHATQISCQTVHYILEVDCENSTIEVDNQSVIKVSPNPFFDELNIEEIVKLSVGERKLVLLNAVGTIIRELEYQPNLKLGELSTGLYFLVLTVDGQRVGASRLIKML